MSQEVNFLIAFASVVGGVEAIRQVQQKARRQEHRSRKNNLVVHCPKSSEYSHMIEGRHVVLSGGKLYIDTGTDHNIPFGHPFAGYYHPFPETQFEGLVSTIMDDPPIMNWICVNRETYEVQYGDRAFAEAQFKGPFDCTRQDRRLMMGGWEGFVAVREGSFWALYFDLDDDRLQSKLPYPDIPVIEVELRRIELREGKPAHLKAQAAQARANAVSEAQRAAEAADAKQAAGVDPDAQDESTHVFGHLISEEWFITDAPDNQTEASPELEVDDTPVFGHVISEEWFTPEISESRPEEDVSLGLESPELD